MNPLRRVLLLGVGLVLLLSGCRADLRGLQTLGVADLASWQSTRSDFVVCDANTPDTRQKFGVIPGAILLSDYLDYQAAAELGSDLGRTLVFYCHSIRCGAGADAARKAIEIGYRDVWVLEPGIVGWTEAGQPVRVPDGGEEAS